MAQDRDNENQQGRGEASLETDKGTGHSLPNASGEVSDEDIKAIDKGVNAVQHGEGGQDHSTDNHEKQAPESGVGAIQDRNNMMSDVAHINEED